MAGGFLSGALLSRGSRLRVSRDGGWVKRGKDLLPGQMGPFSYARTNSDFHHSSL